MNRETVMICFVLLAVLTNGYCLDKAGVWMPMHLLRAIPGNQGRNMPVWVLGYFAFCFAIGFLPAVLGVSGLFLTFLLGLITNAFVFHQPAFEALIFFCLCVTPLVFLHAGSKRPVPDSIAAIDTDNQNPPDDPDDQGKALASNPFNAFKTPARKAEAGAGQDLSALNRRLQASVQEVAHVDLVNPTYWEANGLQNNRDALHNLLLDHQRMRREQNKRFGGL